MTRADAGHFEPHAPRSDDRRRSPERPRAWSLVSGLPAVFRTRGLNERVCGPAISRQAVGQHLLEYWGGI